MMSSVVGRPMEILLIEDSRSDARLTMEALHDSGVKHRLTIVADGEEAMLFLHRQKHFSLAPRPDLILLDLNLPLKDGREVLAEIKDHDQLCRIPVVVLTASQDHEDLLKSQQLHVEGFLRKPVDHDQFVALVRQLKVYWHADVVLPSAD